MSARNRPEAQLEREILRSVGADPRILLMTNPVGEGYYAAIAPLLRDALRPFGPAAQAACQAVLNRNRVSYGAGGVGAPDLLGVIQGRAFGLELKSDSGRLRP